MDSMKHYSTYQSQFIEMFGDPNKGNWTASVADYCYILGGFAFKSDLFSSTGVPIVRISNINDGVVDIDQNINYGYDFWVSNPSYRVLDGDILMAMSGATTGKVGVFRQNVPALLNQRVACIRQKEGKSVSSFLYAALQSEFMYKTIQSSAQGGAQPNISSKQISKLPMPAANILDQKKFESIAQQADKSKFTRLKSQFIEMFGNPVTNDKNWETMPMTDIAPEVPSTTKLSGSVWLLNLDMIESHSGQIIEKVYEDDSKMLSVAPFDTGNVLYSKLRPYLNKVVVPDESGYATTELVPLRPNSEKLNRVFLSHLLRGDNFVNYANSIATGTKMPRMPLGDLRKFKCILPPMDMQLHFVDIAEQADKSKYIN